MGALQKAVGNGLFKGYKGRLVTKDKFKELTAAEAASQTQVSEEKKPVKKNTVSSTLGL